MIGELRRTKVLGALIQGTGEVLGVRQLQKNRKRPYPGYRVIQVRSQNFGRTLGSVKHETDSTLKVPSSEKDLNTPYPSNNTPVDGSANSFNQFDEKDVDCWKWDATPDAQRVFTTFDIKSLEAEDIKSSFLNADIMVKGFVSRSDAKQLLHKNPCYKLSQRQTDDFLYSVFGNNDRLEENQYNEMVLNISDKVDGAVMKLAATFLCTGLSVGIIIPMMPQIANELAISSTQYGLIISSFALAKMFGNIPAARLVDQYGKKKLIVAGLAGLALANLEMSVLLSYESLMSSRITAGLAVACFSTAATVMLSDISTSKNRGRTIAPPITAFSVGTAIGPGLGGILTSHIGIISSFSVVGSAFLAIAGASYFFLKEPFVPEIEKEKAIALKTGKPVKEEGRLKVWKELMKNPQINTIASMHCGYWFVLSGSQMTLLPLLLAGDVFSLASNDLGYIFAGMSIVTVLGTPISGRLLDKFGKIALILPAAMTVGGAMAAASQMSSLPYFLPCLFAWVASGTLLSSGPTAFVADTVTAKQRTSALALLRTAGDVGMLTGAVCAGALADQFGYSNVMFSNGVGLVSLASLVALRFAFIRKNSRKIK